MGGMTLEQAKVKHEQDVQMNQDLGIIQYTSRRHISDRVFEVTEGHHTLDDGQVLGPGQRFRPAVEQLAGRGSLRGKAREITRSEYRSLPADPAERVAVSGADIGVRALPMAQGTLRAALDASLTEADFADVQPSGADGQYTRRQVDELIAAKQAAASGE